MKGNHTYSLSRVRAHPFWLILLSLSGQGEKCEFGLQK